jgi:hypothetical protein
MYHFRIQGACIKFRKDEPQILGAIVQNLIAQANWSQGFVHPCSIPAAKYRGYNRCKDLK